MNNKFTKTLATLLVFCLSIRSFAPVLTVSLKADDEEQAKKEIHIKNEDDFIKFSRDCQLDSYSKNLTCILDKDLDFTGKKFIAVPIFKGSFDGKSHQIKGVKIKDSGSILGVFRINEGSISNLTVQCDMAPTESGNTLGIIAGENRGKIYKCNSIGSIKGDQNIGGITGINKENAVISYCTSDVYITGTVHVGGITGLNEGTIGQCTNNGNINISEDQINESDMSNLLSVNSMNTVKPDFLGDELNSDKDVYSCVGGIAGRNTGYIAESTNKARIGYMHIGANVGGIAGISNGIIENATNSGSIDGRQNIGGITGQFEPNVDIQYGASSIDALHEENKALMQKLRNLNNKIDSTSQNTLDKGFKINRTAKELEDDTIITGSNINQFAKEQVDAIYDSAIKITDNNKELIDEYEEYSKLIIEDTDRVSRDLNRLMNEVTDMLENMNNEASSTNSSISSHRDNLQEKIPAIQANKEMLQPDSEFNQQMNKNAEDMKNAMEKMKKDLGDNFKKIFPNYDPNNPSLPTGNLTVPEQLALIEEMGNQLKKAGVASQNMKDLQSQMKSGLNDNAAALAEVNAINNILQNSVDDITSDNDDYIANIRRYSDDLERHDAILRQDIDELNNILTEGIQFDHIELRKIEDTSKDIFDFANTDLHDLYGDIYDNTSAINQELADLIVDSQIDSKEINALTAQIINNFDRITDIMYDLSQKPEYETVNLFDFTEGADLKGTIIFSKNNGIINGDHNIGGIAGMVDMEPANDTEEQFKLEDNKWQDTNIVQRAIIYKSQNNGTIKAKDNYAGGITGKSMTGYVYDSSNKGNVEGKDYLGGISGYTEGDILNCDVLCDVTGDNHVGGIGGYTNNLTNNRAMVRVFADGENIGAISGEAKDDSDITDNIFVKELVGGIDNTSYEGKAYPIAYEDFIKLENLPVYFDNIYVKFYDGKNLIKSVKVKFNGSIKESDIPPVEYNENTYSEWEEFNRNNISSSKDVYLLHKPWITTISSNEKVPMFLAAGKFSPNAKITVEEFDYNFRKEDYEAAKGYKYTITDNMKGEKGSYQIRVKLAAGEQVKLLKNKKIENMQYTMDGTYAVFENTNSAELLIVTPNYVEYLAFAIIGGILLLIILVFFIRFLKRRTRKRLEKKGLI